MGCSVMFVFIFNLQFTIKKTKTGYFFSEKGIPLIFFLNDIELIFIRF